MTVSSDWPPHRGVVIGVCEVHTAAMADEMIVELVELVELVERHIAPVRAVRLDARTTIGQPARGTGPPYLAHLSSANRPKQTTQGRPVHNECELIDTIDANLLLSALAANLLSALRKPLLAATGKSWYFDRVCVWICKVGARFTFIGRRVVMAIAGTARAIWRALWAEVEKRSASTHDPAQTGV